MSDLLNEIDRLKKKAELLMSNFLKESGWEYTSCTPGGYWLWKKKLRDGSVILVDKLKAVQIQTEMDIA